MLNLKLAALTGLALFICYLDYVTSCYATTDAEWHQYKLTFNKDYTNTATTEAYARYIYTYNKYLISNHNLDYQLGLHTFSLRINQFTDMDLVSFNALFPVTTQPTVSNHVPLPTVNPATATEFDPATDLGYTPTVENQGTVCNSGWAYATAKSIEIINFYNTGAPTAASLSAQNLIDCAGQCSGCTNQVPQTGFDYLTQFKQELYSIMDYPNRINQLTPGMCIRPRTATVTTTLANYARINDGDDATLRQYLPSYPVVVEFNPTSFEFMHYGEGIFQQPQTERGSHFMTAVGFGVNRNASLNYFIAQNSFGRTWGEQGRIRIAYTAAQPFTKSAILPIL